MKQNLKLKLLYGLYNLYDHVPILNLIGLSNRIENNCQSIFYGDNKNIDELWHETFNMIYYDITGTVPKSNVTFDTAHESKVMKWNLSKLHEKNNSKDLTSQQWLNLFQSKVRTLPNEPRYISLMYAHWLYKQYGKSLNKKSANDKEN